MSFTTYRRKWTNLFRSSSRKQRRAGAKPGLQMLHLEDRVTPATFYVSTAGDDTNDGTVLATPFRTIGKALAVAELTAGAPHSVLVAAGTYSTAGVDKGFFIGSGSSLTPNLNNLVLDAGWDSSFTTQTFGSTVYVPQTTANGSLTPSAFDPDVGVFAPGVTIRGFSFVFDGTPGAGGTKVSGGLHSLTNDTFITNNTIEVGYSNTNPRSSGILVHTTPSLYPSAAGVKVMDNTIIADEGIPTKGSTAIFINPDAPGRVTPIIISGNDISGNNLGTGIAIDRLSFVTVDGNTIQRTGTAENASLIDLRHATSIGDPYAAIPQVGIVITNNTLDGLDGSAPNSIGIQLTTRNNEIQQVAGVNISGNIIRDVAFGVLGSQANAIGSGITVFQNSLTNTTNRAIFFTGGTGTLNASNNWFGTNVLATITGLISGSVDYTPYLNLGTDTSAAAGFQGDFSDLTVHSDGAQTGSTGRIQEGINAIADGSLTGAARTLNVLAGSYAGGILINRTMTVSGTGSPTVTSMDLNGQDVGFQIAADNGTLQGFNIVSDGVGTEYGVLLSDKNTGPGYSGATIQNNSFNNLEYAIATADGAFDYSNATIQNNVITIGTGTWGIYLTAGGGGHFVYGNNISGGAGTAGILVQFIDNVTIGGTGAGQGNTFTGTFGSLLVADANNISFIGNTSSGTLGDRGTIRVEGNVNGLTINQNSITGGVNPAIRVRQNFSLTPNSNITANNNFLSGNQYAIQVDADGLGTTLDARFNDMSGNTAGSILNSDVDSIVNASGSYFGSSVLATVSAGITGSVDYTPYLNLGTDTSAAAGFQGDFSDITVHSAGVQTGMTGRIQEGVNAIADGSLTGAARELHVVAGTYNEGTTVTKPLTLLGAQAGVDARTRSGAETIVNFAGGAFGLAADDVTIDGFTLQGQTNNNSGPGFGYAVYMASGGARTGGQVVNNIVQNNNAGIAVANSGANQVVIQNNLFRNNSSGLATDIYADQFTTFGSATNILIDANTFTNSVLSATTWAVGVSNTGATPFTNWTITNNEVTNHGRGFYFYNSDGFEVSDNSISGTTNYAIGLFGLTGLPANTDFSIEDNTLANNLRGIYLADDAPGTAYAGTLTLTGNSYTTSGAQRSIENDSNTAVVATGDTFNTVLASGATTAQQYAIVDTIVDATDVAGLGHVSTLAGHVFVTPNSFFAPATTVANIQRAVDAIPAGGVVHVQAGSYTGDVSTVGANYTLSAGESPAQVVQNGNLTLDMGDTLEIEIGGLNAATDYDNLIVTGTVTLGGATLSVQQFGMYMIGTMSAESYTIISNDGADPVTGIFNGLPEGTKINYAGGNLYITYQGGDGNDVVLNNYPVINGTAGADTVVLTPTATGYDYTVNGGATQSVIGTLPFAFNGLDGDDTMIVNLNANPIPTIFYDGGDQDTPANAGANTVFGDVLVVVDTAMVGTHTVTYTGAGTLPMTGGFAGTVTVIGENTINFTGLEPVDIVNMAVVNVTFANADDAITIAEGLDSATNSLAALVVSGTSGGVGFEQVHLRNNTQVNINTTTVSGNDSITIASAANAHGNVNLSITTGGGTDSIEFDGDATFAGTVALNSKSIQFNGGLLTAGTTSLTAGAGGVSTNGAGQDIETGSLTISSGGAIGSAVNRLEIDATTLQFTAVGFNAFITDVQGGLQVNNSSVGAANTIDLAVTGGNLTSVVDGTRDLGAQTLVIDVTGGTIGTGTASRLEINAVGTLTATTDGGDIFLRQVSTGTQSLAVANVSAGAGNVDILVSDGNLTSAAGDAGVADIVGTNVTLRLGTAGRNFGVNAGNRLEIDATLLQLTTITTAQNNAFIVDTAGGLQVTDSTLGTNGSTFNLLVQNGNLTSKVDGTGDVRADNVVLETTGTGTIGTAPATPLEINAILSFNATTANQDAFVSDVVGDLPLGLANVGSGSAYLQAAAAITDVNGAANNVAAASVALVAGTSVGAGNAIETTVGSLAASATTGSVSVANTGSLDLTTVNGVVGVSAGTTNVVSTTTDLTVSQPVSAGTTTTLTFGSDNAGRNATVNAAINGTGASITGGTGADSITVNTSGTAPLTLDGGEASDTYIVNVGTLNAAVAATDTGTMGTDTLTVNGTTGADTFEVNTATGGNSTVEVNGDQVITYTNTIETLNLDGGDDADTYNVFFAQGVGSFLPATVNIADTGVMGTDVANVSGTDNADSIDVNFTATRTTTLGGESVRYVNGNLETLNVFSKAGNDVVFAKAVSLPGGPVVNLNGGSPSNPTPLPGDILVLDVTGMMGLNTSNIKTPAGSVTSSSHNALSWVDFETIPTPIGLGGTFDFGTKTSPVQVGPYVVPPPGSYWVGVSNTDTYPTKGYYGWSSPVNSTDRGAASPNPALTTFHNVLRDSNWFGPLNVSGTFIVAVAAGDYQVSVTIGDTAVVMDSIFVTIEGLADPIAVQKGLQGQFSTVTGIGSDANNNGKIEITIVDKAGTHSYWHVNAIDVRPVGLVSPVTITRGAMVEPFSPLVADGLSTTMYEAAGFFPNAIVTIATTGGKITTTDVDPFLVGVQVKADANGVATFDLQHPTGNADVTLTASAAIVVDAKGAATQSFTLTPSQKIDFNSATSPTESGYLGFSNTLYTGTASNGLGWQGPVSLGDRGAAAGSALFRDFVFNLQGAANAGTFVIDLPTDAPHVITVYLGDTATARDRMQIEVADSPTTFAPVSQALTEIRSLKTNSLTFTVTPYANGGTFQTRLRFSDLGGTQNGWSVQGIEYRTLASQGVLGVTPVAPVMGNGTAVTNYVITGGAVDGLVTLTSQFGAILGTDASALYDGFQVQLDGSGVGSFAIQSPVVAAGTLASKVSLVAVNGSHAATFTQEYDGVPVKYDFGTATSPVATATGFTYLSGSQIATAQNGVGFKAAAGQYDRNPTTYPNVNLTADPDLFRDAVSGAGSGTFRVLVEAGATGVPVRVYSYDAFSSRGPITVTAEGGAKQTLTPSMTTPAVYDVLGDDLNGDGFLDITVSGNAVWMMNGIEVG